VIGFTVTPEINFYPGLPYVKSMHVSNSISITNLPVHHNLVCPNLAHRLGPNH